jgi:hypothetical protein
MGMHTVIYGYIEEMDFWLDPIKKKIRKHNSDIIKSLPAADKWPPLSREMFAICNNYKNHTGPNFEYWGRIIHFGANLKSVEQEWGEWRNKFESLLTRLYFMEARVHVQTEYMRLDTSSWKVDLSKYKVLHDASVPRPIALEDCDYESSSFDKMFGNKSLNDR